MQTIIPVNGEIYKVKFRSGRTWLFKSAYNGGHITEHQGAYCIDGNGDTFFHNYVTRDTGCHVGCNLDIILLKPANINEIAIFERKLG